VDRACRTQQIAQGNENMQKSQGQECWGRTAATGNLGKDSQDRTAKESVDSTGRTRKRGQDG
jgi:hypothetical protein